MLCQQNITSRMDVKDRIQQKAEELFNRYGIRSVTMDEIASQLGISKKTIYQSFADKDELVFAVFNKHMVENENHCNAAKEQSDNAIHAIFLDLDMVEEMLQTMNPYILYDLERFHPNVFKKFTEYKHGFLYRMIKDNINRGIQEDLYRADIDIEIISRYRVGTLMIAMNMDIFPKGHFNILDIELEIVLLFLYGIATPKGIKLIHKYNQQRKRNKSTVL